MLYFRALRARRRALVATGWRHPAGSVDIAHELTAWRMVKVGRCEGEVAVESQLTRIIR
jgi:hypothetical protein